MSKKVNVSGGLRSNIEQEELQELLELYSSSDLNTQTKLENFPLFARRQNLTRFLSLYEIYKLILPVKGSIIECGVNYGFGVMTWHKLSAILEPVNLTRRIYGFDTFEGFPSLQNEDLGAHSDHIKVGDLKAESYSELSSLIKNADKSRFLGHVEKTFLIKGDVMETIPKFIEENPHLLVSLLFLDFDLFEPTKIALEYIFPRMPKGAVIAFDELDNPLWPGETLAMLDFFKEKKLKIQRSEFDPYIGYAII